MMKEPATRQPLSLLKICLKAIFKLTSDFCSIPTIPKDENDESSENYKKTMHCLVKDWKYINSELQHGNSLQGISGNRRLYLESDSDILIPYTNFFKERIISGHSDLVLISNLQDSEFMEYSNYISYFQKIELRCITLIMGQYIISSVVQHKTPSRNSRLLLKMLLTKSSSSTAWKFGYSSSWQSVYNAVTNTGTEIRWIEPKENGKGCEIYEGCFKPNLKEFLEQILGVNEDQVINLCKLYSKFRLCLKRKQSDGSCKKAQKNVKDKFHKIVKLAKPPWPCLRNIFINLEMIKDTCLFPESILYSITALSLAILRNLEETTIHNEFDIFYFLSYLCDLELPKPTFRTVHVKCSSSGVPSRKKIKQLFPNFQELNTTSSAGYNISNYTLVLNQISHFPVGRSQTLLSGHNESQALKIKQAKENTKKDFTSIVKAKSLLRPKVAFEAKKRQYLYSGQRGNNQLRFKNHRDSHRCDSCGSYKSYHSRCECDIGYYEDRFMYDRGKHKANKLTTRGINDLKDNKIYH